jgi:hypothetical protein
LFRVFFLSFVTLAFLPKAQALSAHRETGQYWQFSAEEEARHAGVPFHNIFETLHKVDDARFGRQALVQSNYAVDDNAYELRQPLTHLDLDLIPEWTLGKKELQESFVKARDFRFLEQDSQPGFKRRVPWLYPDEGCYLRADWMDRLLDKDQRPSAAKLYVFGDLEVRTENSPTGSVSWWFHVVLAYKFQNVIYVLDPSMEATRPMTLKEWSQRISTDPETLTFSICVAKSSSPYTGCRQAEALSEADLARLEQEYLQLEWDRMVELKKNPRQVLGDSPPWL